MVTSSTKSESGNLPEMAAPIYITIGPQCCGKTTVLKDIEGLQDVCLDDQLDVYVSIATQQWLDLLKATKEPSASEQKYPEELQQEVQGKTIAQRIQNDNAELNIILKRWSGALAEQEFADALSQHYANNVRSFNRKQQTGDEGTPNTAQVLIAAVEEFLSTKPKFPEQTDVFCLESLFKPHAKTNQSAIQVAHDRLKEVPPNIPVAWGNTNSNAKDFQQALDIARTAKRPVHFVLSHPKWKLENEKHNLPWVELPALLTRSLQRLQATGRYIPANSIADCCQRIQDDLIPSDCRSAWEVEQALVYKSTQPVRRHEKPLPFRYRLTRDRLIEKENLENRPPQGQYPRQDQQRQYHGPHSFSWGGPRYQQGRYSNGPPQHNRHGDYYDDRRHYRGGPPQYDRRRDYDDRRQQDRPRRRDYNGGRYSRGGRGGRGGRWSQQGHRPSGGKRCNSDYGEQDGNSYGYGDNKRYRSKDE